MTALEQLGAFVARCAEPSSRVREILALHVVDTIGAWLAGVRTAEGAALLRWRENWRETWNDASHDRREATPERALDPTPRLRLDLATHCALARLSEIDDIHLASTTTPGAIVIPGAIAISAAFGASDPRTIAAAIVAGYETMVRLGEAIGGSHVLYRGIWPSYFAAPVAIAAVAARLLKLDELETAHALALALARASPGVGRHNKATTSRWLAFGEAAATGLIAALAARAGFTSDLALLDGAFLPDVYGIKPDAAALTAALGERQVLSEVSFKPWCAARQTMAATQGVIEIVGSGVPSDAMTRLTGYVPPPHRRMIDHGVIPGDRASFLTSLPYLMAVAALAPQALYDVGAPSKVAEPLRAFMTRIAIAEDDALVSGYPRHWPARVKVVTASGCHECTVTHVPGDPARPYDAAAVEEKFRRFAEPVIGVASAGAMLEGAFGLIKGETPPAQLLRDIERHRGARHGDFESAMVSN